MDAADPAAGAAKAVATRGRPFKPGQSGNPAGRAKGARFSIYAELDAAATEAMPEIVAGLVTAAKGGDSRAAELLMRRVYPERKGRPLTFAVPDASGVNGLSQAMDAVTVAMAKGEMSPEEAAAVAGVLEVHRKVIATEDHEARIQALEGARS